MTVRCAATASVKLRQKGRLSTRGGSFRQREADAAGGRRGAALLAPKTSDCDTTALKDRRGGEGAWRRLPVGAQEQQLEG